METKRILIVEDDSEINKLLSIIISEMGHDFVSAYSGTEGLLQLENHDFNLVLLDLMLPGMDGIEVLSEIRKKSSIPVIIISAKSGIEDKVKLLKIGADDYMTKPIERAEVEARIEVQLRREVNFRHDDMDLIKYKEISIDNNKRKVSLDGVVVELTNSEYDILLLMVQRPGHAFSKSEIYTGIWNGPYLGDDNTISVHISNIRKKFSKITSTEYIKTIWGIGFKLE
ncbi:response regulator transcription factor [Microaceticoccus formicicus]|uniref:response regulator transcription factor n=1 Tax=Microaceticoccus formicicus TaxID=3118105 RepID=UPI003CD01F0D|nr:response regulator transcription factor [Peptoniphilaceae bacterium AMB_02]